MPTLEFRRAHNGQPEEAVEKIKAVVEDFNSRYSSHVDSVHWGDDGLSASASGKRFRSTFTVDNSHVNVSVELLGMIAKVLKPKVESKLMEMLDLHFPITE